MLNYWFFYFVIIIFQMNFKLFLISFVLLVLAFSKVQYRIVKPPKFALAKLNPNGNNTLSVLVQFRQLPKENIQIFFSGRNLKPNSKYGIHIHEFGDLSQGCTSAGSHFNPDGTTHGGLNSEIRHAGDLGNLVTDENGNSEMKLEDQELSLNGINSILGRMVVLHQNEDDLGTKQNQDSKKTGNSGPRIACGVIGLSKQLKKIN